MIFINVFAFQLVKANSKSKREYIYLFSLNIFIRDSRPIEKCAAIALAKIYFFHMVLIWRKYFCI